MPTYQYVCADCGSNLEAVQTFSEPSLTDCPTCGGSLRKKFSAVGVVFKGSGFYRNDSRSDARNGSAERKSESGEKTEGKSESSTKAETKSEPAAKTDSAPKSDSSSSSAPSSSSSSGTSGSGSSGSGGSGSGSKASSAA